MAFGPERRGSLRLMLDPGKVKVKEPAFMHGSTVVDLCAEGGGLVLPAGLASKLDGAEIELDLGDHLLLHARVKLARSLPLDSERCLVGVSFSEMNTDDLGLLSQFLMNRHEQLSAKRSLDEILSTGSFGASTRDQVQGLLDYYLFGVGRQLKVYQNGTLLPIFLKAIEQQVLQGVMLIRLQVLGDSGENLVRGQTYTFYFNGTNSLNFFLSSIRKVSGSLVWITFPGRIMQTGFRESMRAKLPLGQIFLEMPHPRLVGRTIAKPILDVGARGLSFSVSPIADALFPGEHLKDIKIHLPDYLVRANAVIRSVKTNGVQGLIQCGLELLGFVSQKDEAAWDHFVIRSEYSTCHLGGPSDLNDLWVVLESSGYLKEYVSEKKNHMARQFFSCWNRCTDNPQLGRFLLLKRENRSVGTLSLSLVYPETWMVHHFGIDKNARLDKLGLFSLARDAYCSLAYLLQQTASIQWWLVFFDVGNRWKKWICTDFVSRYPNKEDFVHDGYSLFKWTQGARVEAPSCREIELLSDTGLDGLLSDHLRVVCHPLEFAAFSYSSQELLMKQFEKTCWDLGYERTRSVFHALYQGKLVASLIAETGQEGVNLFGLMNRCTIIFFSPDVAERSRIMQCLLLRAIEHYQDRGKREFLFMGNEELEGNPLFLPLGLEFVTKGIRLLSGKKILPTYLNYLDELLRILHG